MDPITHLRTGGGQGAGQEDKGDSLTEGAETESRDENWLTETGKADGGEADRDITEQNRAAPGCVPVLTSWLLADEDLSFLPQMSTTPERGRPEDQECQRRVGDAVAWTSCHRGSL